MFRDQSHHNTELYMLPSDDSMTQLEDKLNNFRKAYHHGTNPPKLYYDLLDHQHANRSVWQAHRDGATLVWSDRIYKEF